MWKICDLKKYCESESYKDDDLHDAYSTLFKLRSNYNPEDRLFIHEESGVRLIGEPDCQPLDLGYAFSENVPNFEEFVKACDISWCNDDRSLVWNNLGDNTGLPTTIPLIRVKDIPYLDTLGNKRRYTIRKHLKYSESSGFRVEKVDKFSDLALQLLALRISTLAKIPVPEDIFSLPSVWLALSTSC
jgi:hypothetical protein